MGSLNLRMPRVRTVTVLIPNFRSAFGQLFAVTLLMDSRKAWASTKKESLDHPSCRVVSIIPTQSGKCQSRTCSKTMLEEPRYVKLYGVGPLLGLWGAKQETPAVLRAT